MPAASRHAKPSQANSSSSYVAGGASKSSRWDDPEFFNFFPEFEVLPESGSVPRRIATVLAALAVAAFAAYDLHSTGMTKTVTQVYAPSLIYDWQGRNEVGGATREVVSELWDLKMPEDQASWEGSAFSANSMPEVAVDLYLYGSNMAAANITQRFGPYSRCHRDIGNLAELGFTQAIRDSGAFEASITTMMATGKSELLVRETLLYGDTPIRVPWSGTTVRSRTDGCERCDRSSSGSRECGACFYHTRVKLCGHHRPGSQVSNGGGRTDVVINLPMSNSSDTMKVGVNMTFRSRQGGSEVTDIAVRPYEKVVVTNSLAIDLDSDSEIRYGGYTLNTDGQVLVGKEDPNFNSREGQELRLTLGSLFFTRTVLRWQEFFGEVGGAAGIILAIFKIFAVGLEMLGKRCACTSSTRPALNVYSTEGMESSKL